MILTTKNLRNPISISFKEKIYEAPIDPKAMMDLCQIIGPDKIDHHDVTKEGQI